VSTAIAPDHTLPAVGGSHHFLLRRLHSLTGIVFGGYIIVHLLVNASLIQGMNPDVYQIQVDKIHSLPFLLGIEWAFIYLPILFHTFYGIWITLTGQPNAPHYPYIKNWFYVWQRISAIVIALFIAFHVLAMKGLFGSSLRFDDHHATLSTFAHINASPVLGYVVYPLGIIASCYHLSNGLWTAAITWGLTVSSAAQKRWGYICGAIFIFTLTCGMLALGSAIVGRAKVIHPAAASSSNLESRSSKEVRNSNFEFPSNFELRTSVFSAPQAHV